MEVLACPHCERMFHVTPGVLGRKIRCRGCREIFNVPADTTGVPLSPGGTAGGVGSALPLAIPCVSDGHDARSCPECGRIFRMNESFANKTIRCRDCRTVFRVGPTDKTLAEPAAGGVRSAPPPPAPPPHRSPSTPPPIAVDPGNDPPPTIFEDIGDVLEEIQPGEQVASVVRPGRFHRESRPPAGPLARVFAVALGGVCALPATLIIVWLIAPERYRGIVAALPSFLRDLLQ